jgi:hypothetical protein
MQTKTKKPAPLTLATEIVITSHHPGDWHDDEFGPSTHRDILTMEEIIDQYSDQLSDYATEEQIARIKAGVEADLVWFLWDCLREELNCGDGFVDIVTKDLHDEQEKEADYRRAEEAVKGFCARKGLTPNSIEFVLALEEEQRSLNSRRERAFDYECRAERWMDSRFSGQSQEGYWSDEDSLHSKFEGEQENISLALDWLSRECPLLMAKVAEQRLANPQPEDEDEDL